MTVAEHSSGSPAPDDWVLKFGNRSDGCYPALRLLADRFEAICGRPL